MQLCMLWLHWTLPPHSNRPWPRRCIDYVAFTLNPPPFRHAAHYCRTVAYLHFGASDLMTLPRNNTRT